MSVAHLPAHRPSSTTRPRWICFLRAGNLGRRVKVWGSVVGMQGRAVQIRVRERERREREVRQKERDNRFHSPFALHGVTKARLCRGMWSSRLGVGAGHLFSGCGWVRRLESPAAVQGYLARKKRTPLGPYRRPLPRVLGRSLGVRRFLMGEIPLYPPTAPR